MRWRPRVNWENRPAALRGPTAHHAARVLVALAVAVVTYLLFPAAPAVQFPVLEVGAVSPTNVIAPFQFRVPKSETDLAREREDAVRSVVPQFEYVPAAVDSARAELQAFMQAVGAAAGSAANDGDRDNDDQAHDQRIFDNFAALLIGLMAVFFVVSTLAGRGPQIPASAQPASNAQTKTRRRMPHSLPE